MNVAVIGASGNVGAVVVRELLARGHRVTALSRRLTVGTPEPGLTTLPADIDNPADLAAKLAGHDAVISSVRFADFDHTRLIGAIRDSGVARYLVVGGAGSLRLPDGRLEFDRPEMPEPARHNSKLGGDYLARLADSGLDWSFLAPSRRFVDGARTGRFRLGLDDLLIAADGTSGISWQDFAVALVDELESPRHSRRRFTVGY